MFYSATRPTMRALLGMLLLPAALLAQNVNDDALIALYGSGCALTLVNVATGEVTPDATLDFTADSICYEDFAVSSDGTRVAYDGDLYGVDVYDATANSSDRYGMGYWGLERIRLSSDGRYVATWKFYDTIGVWDLLVFNVEANGIRVVDNAVVDTSTSTEDLGLDDPNPWEMAAPSAAQGPWLSWTPDSEAFVYAAQDYDRNSMELYRYTVGTGKITALTDSTTDDMFPTVSPDGRLVAFTAVDGDTSELWLLNLDSGVVQTLGLAGDGLRPAWSPDGTQIAFLSAHEGGVMSLYVVNANGAGVRRLTEDLDASELWLAWLPQPAS